VIDAARTSGDHGAAYLIRRAGEWSMLDTGIEDAVANEPGGRIIAHDIRGIVVRTISCQLADVGITPAGLVRNVGMKGE
jgi:N-acyl homoserine lactone hydrolase